MDILQVRRDFPILERTFEGKPLVYLDNAASTQKPRQVIQSVAEFYSKSYSNVHRAISSLSVEATELFEQAREKVASFVGAKPEEIVFTRNTTESINALAYSLGESIENGDAIVVTEMDHHSNIVPWQQLAKRKKAELFFVPVTDNGELAEFDFPSNTKIFAFPQVSNVLGTINDVSHWAKKAKEVGALVVLDGAAGAPHGLPKEGVDFYAFSGHKMLGPMGAGVLWGEKELLEAMPPFLYGGSMILRVEKERSEWAEAPQKFEAGTPDAGGAIGLGAAIDYLRGVGFEAIRRHEELLTKKALDLLSEIQGLVVYGRARERVGIVSFNVKGAHTHDVGSILDSEGIAVRSGHHCAQVLMQRLGVVGATRASFYLYNTEKEVERLADAVKKAKSVFA